MTEKAASSGKSATGKLPVASGTSTKVGTPKAAMPAKAVESDARNIQVVGNKFVAKGY